MIDQKRRDLHAVLVEHDAFADVVALDRDAGARDFFVHVAADVNVEGERLFECAHHVARAVRSPDLERRLASRRSYPASQEQIRNLHHVIGMQMRQEQSADRTDRNTCLYEANGCTSAAVEQESLAARLHERACAKLSQIHRRTAAGSEQGDSETVGWDRLRRRRIRHRHGLRAGDCRERFTVRCDQRDRENNERGGAVLVHG